MKCFVGVGLLATTLLLGCSDDREPIPSVPDGGNAADAEVIEAGADVSADAPTTDGYIDLFDVFPFPDAGCPGCIRDRCGAQINACFNNPACGAGLVCTLQMCAADLIGGDGGFSPTSIACVFGCFNGDQATALMAIGSLTCLTMTCGGVCGLQGVDAGVDVRPDVPVRPDASTQDATDESTPDTGSEPEAGGPDGDDAADDAMPESGNAVDVGTPPSDAVSGDGATDTAAD
jgi:hypothetical protein